MGWLSHPVTREVLRALRQRREELKESWARGSFTLESIEASALKNAEKIGEVNQLSDFIEMDYQAYLGWINYEPVESEWETSVGPGSDASSRPAESI